MAPYGPGSPVTGTISSFGYARPTLVPGQLAAKALAFSATTIHARGGWLMRTGGFRWRPIVRNTAAGSAARTRVQQCDPIEFVVEDLETGEVVQGTLLSIDVDIATAEEEGGFTWEDNQVNIDTGTDVIFEIDQTSPHVSPSGSLLLEIIGGVVTQSYGSGAYANVPLPAVGTPLPITFDLLSEIEFDYDLGDFQGHDLNVDMYMGGAGEGYPELGDVPTPGDLNCDEAVNAFDIDAFVMALANPTGYEMMFPNCEILSADCNDDGIVDAFDIDPFVELLTGG